MKNAISDDDVSVAYCGKTAKHYQKLFEENSSVEF